MASTTIDTSKLAFCSIFTNNKGARQLPALFLDGEAVAWQPEEYMSIPFEPSAFNDAAGTSFGPGSDASVVASFAELLRKDAASKTFGAQPLEFQIRRRVRASVVVGRVAGEVVLCV